MFIEMWIFYAILAGICIGIFSFTTKIVSENNYDKDLSLFYLMGFSVCFAVLSFVLFSKVLFSFDSFFIALIPGMLYPLNLKLRMTSLKFISSSTYFINYRIFSSTILFISGIYFFSEIVSIFQWIGMLLGFYIFYLLLEKKSNTENKKDFRTGVLYMLYGVVLIVFVNSAIKYIAVSGFDIYSFLVNYMIISLITSFLFSPKKIIKSHNLKNINTRFILFSINQAFFFIGSIIFVVLGFELGNLGAVYKIMSYSLFIPIILSIIFYKEKVTLRKSFAFVLTIISIYLFSI